MLLSSLFVLGTVRGRQLYRHLKDDLVDLDTATVFSRSSVAAMGVFWILAVAFVFILLGMLFCLFMGELNTALQFVGDIISVMMQYLLWVILGMLVLAVLGSYDARQTRGFVTSWYGYDYKKTTREMSSAEVTCAANQANRETWGCFAALLLRLLGLVSLVMLYVLFAQCGAMGWIAVRRATGNEILKALAWFAASSCGCILLLESMPFLVEIVSAPALASRYLFVLNNAALLLQGLA